MACTLCKGNWATIVNNSQQSQTGSQIPVVWTLMLTLLSEGWGMLYPENCTLGLEVLYQA